MKKLIYILIFFFSSGCRFFWPLSSSMTDQRYIKDRWEFFKEDSANNIVIYNMLNYDEERAVSTIKLKFINKNDSIYVSVKYQLRIIFYEDKESEFYHKKKMSILRSKREDGNFFVKIQPYGFAILISTMEGIRIRKISFYSYEAL